MTADHKAAFHVVPLNATHDRTAFSCGVESLDRYLTTQASQAMRRKANAVFVLAPSATPHRIVGYFTICATALAPGHIPESARKHIPRYPLVSATLIGRLAVDTQYRGQGLGGMLLARALRIAYLNADVVGSSMIVVDAPDARAAAFHAAHGFTQLSDTSRLIIPMRTVGQLI